jgi:hypothetical protein
LPHDFSGKLRMRGHRLQPKGLASRAISGTNLTGQGDVACLTRWLWHMPYSREIHVHQCFAIIRK